MKPGHKIYDQIDTNKDEVICEGWIRFFRSMRRRKTSGLSSIFSKVGQNRQPPLWHLKTQLLDFLKWRQETINTRASKNQVATPQEQERRGEQIAHVWSFTLFPPQFSLNYRYCTAGTFCFEFIFVQFCTPHWSPRINSVLHCTISGIIG